MHLIATWLTGPDCGGRHHLAHGTTVVGTAGLGCDDPALLAHHALVEVGADGPWITQLSGIADLTIGGRPPMGRTPVPLGAPVGIAASTLVITRDVVAPTSPRPWSDGSPRRIERTPRATPPEVGAALDALATAARTTAAPGTDVPDAPPEPERPGGLTPTLVGLAGSAVLALATRRPMFLAFGAIGAAAACSSWVTQWLAFRRRHRRHLAEHVARRDRAIVEAAQAHRQRVDALQHAAPGVTRALALAADPEAGLWVRRSTHRDAFAVSLGIDADDGSLPVVADLGHRARLALCGPLAQAVSRAVVAQLVTQCGPADLRIVVVTRRPQHWTWLDGLPHLASDDGPMVVEPETVADVFDALPPTEAHVVVVVDDRDALTDRATALRRLVDRATSTMALVAVVDDDAPHVCSAQLTTTVRGSGTWRADAVTTPTTVLVGGLGDGAAARAVQALATCTDPEDTASAIATMPAAVELDDLLAHHGRPTTAAAIARDWASHGPYPDPPPAALLGVGAHGAIEIDLVRDGPHALIAGTTGSGKSELLRTLVVGLAVACDPRHLSFVLVDYKGGAAFDALARLPHVTGVITDLDDRLADRTLRSLHAEIRRREAVLRAAGVADLGAYRATPCAAQSDVEPLPRLVVIVDEFAALAAERPSFLHALVGIAQRGRSLGLHLVLATQRPGGLVGDDIRANTTLRIALRLHEATDAVDVVGDRLPVTIARSRPGRAVVRLGGDTPELVQTAYCGAIDRLVDRLVDATAISRLGPPPRPWLPPLPTTLDQHDVAPDAIGVLDDPDHQCRHPLRHRPGDGPLVVVGQRGAGVTTTLRAVVGLHRHLRPHRAVHVIDAHGDPLWQRLDELGIAQRWVVTDADRGGVTRLVHHLRTTSPADCTIVVDGIDEARAALDTPAHDHRLEHRHETHLEQLLLALSAVANAGGDVLLGAANPSLVPAELLARAPHRWVMHLADPHRATAVGMPASLVPPAVAGRVRVDALLGQVAAPAPHGADRDHGSGPVVARPPWWIHPLPEVIDRTALAPSLRHSRCTDLAVGVHALDGSEVRITIDDGEHLMVLGPRGTGRTTALGTVVAGLRSTGAVTPFAVDDAERVDDPDAALLRHLDRGDVSIVVAARGDALRQRTGHWSGTVRRARLGIVLVGADGDAAADGELLGVALPRRYPVPLRPGAAWLIDGSTVVPVVIARGVAQPDRDHHAVEGGDLGRHGGGALIATASLTGTRRQ